MAKKDNNMIEPFTIYLSSLGIVLLIYIITLFLFRKKSAKKSEFKLQKQIGFSGKDVWKKLSDAVGGFINISDTRRVY